MNEKFYKRELQKANKALREETHKQVDIFYCAAGVVLWNHGWRLLRIRRRFSTSMKAWDECGDYGQSKSMLQMFEEETGIELTVSGYDKSYHDYAFLDGTKWNGKPLPYPQLIQTKRMKKDWVGLMVFACICLSLHRDEGYGYERIVRFINEVDEIRRKLGDKDTEPYKKLFFETTGHEFHELSTMCDEVIK